MKKLIFPLLLILLLSFSALAQTPEGGVVEEFGGQVVTTAGVGVEGVTIRVFVDPSTCPFWQTGFYTAQTSPFGYYNSYMHADCPTFVQPSGKGMQFDPPIRFFFIGTAGNPVNFTRTNSARSVEGLTTWNVEYLTGQGIVAEEVYGLDAADALNTFLQNHGTYDPDVIRLTKQGYYK